MQSISDNLKYSLAKKNPIYVKKIELYRRKWNGSAFIWESAEDITDEVIGHGNVFWKLDNEDFGAWRLDNISITFRNDRNQWKQGNSKGHWTGDYILNQSKMEISTGAELADETTETMQSFTGYVSGDPVYSPDGKEVSISLISAMSIFEKFFSEDISTQVTDELLGQDVGDEFTTANNVVGIIDIVKRGTTTPAAASEIKPNTDYNDADLKSKTLPAKITLTTALTAGEKLWISYKQLYTDKTIKWIAEQIMTLCDITSYNIEDAVFETDIQNTFTQNTQAHWNAATLENIDTITAPDSFKPGIIDDFKDGDYSANPTWSVIYGSGFSVEYDALKASSDGSSGSVIKKAATDVTGTWQFNLTRQGSITALDYFTFYFIGADEEPTLKYPRDGYYLSFSNNNILLKRVLGNLTLIDSGTVDWANKVVKVDRDSSGNFELWIDGVSKGTANDTTYNTSEGIYIRMRDYSGDDLDFYFTNLFFWEDGTTVGQGTLISPVQDCSAALTSFGLITSIYNLNSGTVNIYTYSSGTIDFSADNDPAGWVEITGIGQIQSVLKRYIKVKIITTISGSSAPKFDEFVLYYYTSSTDIAIVDLTGKNCFEALEELVGMPAYEMGFSPLNEFFMRKRQTGSPSVLDIRSNTNLIRIDNFNDGIDRVFNRVIANFRDYQKISDASGDTQPNSIDKYGTREYSVSSDNLLPNDNVNIAFAIAPTILAYTKNPRRRVRAVCQYLPQLELGDKITLYSKENAALRQWKWGDKDVKWGQANLEYYNQTILTARLNFWNVEMRVEGIEIDFKNWFTILNLVEVI